MCIKLIFALDETSAVMADYASPHGRANRLDGMEKDIGVPASFPLFVSICKTASDPFLGLRGIVPEYCTGNDLNNGELQAPRSQLGHLYVGPQSKSRYVSAGFFAMISQEARLLCRTSAIFLLTLRRLQKLITCSSSNSNIHSILSFAFGERRWTTLRKPDRIVVAL